MKNQNQFSQKKVPKKRRRKRKNKGIPPNATVFMGGVPIEYTEATLYPYFDQFGKIDLIVLQRRKKSPEFNLGFGYIVADPQATASILARRHHIVKGRKIECQPFFSDIEENEQSIHNKQKRTLEVAHIPIQWDNRELLKFFAKFGRVENCYFLPSKEVLRGERDFDEARRAVVIFEGARAALEVVGLARDSELGFGMTAKRRVEGVPEGHRTETFEPRRPPRTARNRPELENEEKYDFYENRPMQLRRDYQPPQTAREAVVYPKNSIINLGDSSQQPRGYGDDFGGHPQPRGPGRGFDSLNDREDLEMPSKRRQPQQKEIFLSSGGFFEPKKNQEFFAKKNQKLHQNYQNYSNNDNNINNNNTNYLDSFYGSPNELRQQGPQNRAKEQYQTPRRPFAYFEGQEGRQKQEEYLSSRGNPISPTNPTAYQNRRKSAPEGEEAGIPASRNNNNTINNKNETQEAQTPYSRSQEPFDPFSRRRKYRFFSEDLEDLEAHKPRLQPNQRRSLAPGEAFGPLQSPDQAQSLFSVKKQPEVVGLNYLQLEDDRQRLGLSFVRNNSRMLLDRPGVSSESSRIWANRLNENNENRQKFENLGSTEFNNHVRGSYPISGDPWDEFYSYPNDLGHNSAIFGVRREDRSEGQRAALGDQRLLSELHPHPIQQLQRRDEGYNRGYGPRNDQGIKSGKIREFWTENPNMDSKPTMSHYSFTYCSRYHVKTNIKVNKTSWKNW